MAVNKNAVPARAASAWKSTISAEAPLLLLDDVEFELEEVAAEDEATGVTVVIRLVVNEPVALRAPTFDEVLLAEEPEVVLLPDPVADTTEEPDSVA